MLRGVWDLGTQVESIESLFSLRGKVVVITGAAGYLGRACTEGLLLAGARVVMFGRGQKNEDYARQLKARYDQELIDFRCVDLYQDDQFRNVLSQIADSYRSVDILVNNAFEFSKETGFNDPSGRMESISKSQWMRSLESGVYWHALATQVVGPYMVKQRSGSIINISSMYGIVSPDPDLYQGTDIFNPPSYGASKAALLALTRYYASFYGEYGIRCNAIVPGAFPNVDPDAYNSPNNDEFITRLCAKTALKRYGKPEELVGAVVYLASDASSYMTGQTLVLDGGWTIK